MTKASTDFIKRIKKTRELYLFLLPAIIFYIVFKYVPIYGVQVAFRDFSPLLGFWKSPWIGLENFRQFFNSNWVPVVRNTIVVSFSSMVVGFPTAIILALLLHHTPNKTYRRIVQMTLYAPHFISTVVLVGMMYTLFSPSIGVVNSVLKLFGASPIFFMGRTEYFLPLYAGSGVWQSAGWSAVIYLAALSGVNPELHESALMDGANKFKRILHIDIPCILPAIITMFLLSIGNIFSVGFDKAFLMQNPLNLSESEVISTLIYKRGLLGTDQGFAAAIGLLDNALNMITLVIFNRIAKRISGTGLW